MIPLADKNTKFKLNSNSFLTKLLTQGQYANDFLERVFSIRCQRHPYADRPDEVFGKRKYDDGDFGWTDVHYANP